MTIIYKGPSEHRFPGPARQVGYTVSAGVNAILLYVVSQLLEWGWPAFLTSEFDEVLPIVQLTFAASIVANLAYLFYDPPWFKSATQVILSAIGLVAALRILSVFPFDFSGYDLPWITISKAILWIAVIGTSIGILAEGVKLIRHGARELTS